ncbi:MAG: UDP-N-acetylmuramate--L-alanine ligase [Clostridia bacterium]|nr:UDP-N-acetylmuramate--L-alanine ligase [Clostridia bacterium]
MEYQQIHFVGIGGVSMSALAEIMHLRGTKVTGSDNSESPAVAHLREIGIPVWHGHRASQVEGADLVVYTAAIPQNNVELAAAREKGIPVVERAVFLGWLLKGYAYPIGVSGTHGKTTCTSMISQILLQAALDPTILIGGTFPLIGGNYQVGSSPYVVYEACEYVDSFLNFTSFVTVILNIEEDHLDYFSGIDAIRSSFLSYARLTLPGGCLIANGDDPNVALLLKEYEGKRLVYSLKDSSADYYARPLPSSGGITSFEIMEAGQSAGTCRLNVPGRHNMMNALAASAAARAVGVSWDVILTALSAFGGAKRRFEAKGTLHGVPVFDDYAHHPSEIAATLRAARERNPKRLICLFQPHTYSRTKALWKEFAASLALADLPVLLDVYAAREAPDPEVSSEALAKEIPNAHYAPSFEEAEAFLSHSLQEGDLLITMGAGDVYKVGELLLAEEAPNV